MEVSWKLPNNGTGKMNLNRDPLGIGVAPNPFVQEASDWERFKYHVCMGLLMHFPVVDILVFSWKNRHLDNYKECR